MNVIRGVLLACLLGAAAAPVWAGETVIRAEVVSAHSLPAMTQDAFPADVEYHVEALNQTPNNATRARIELRYSCVDSQSGGRVIPCYITLDPPVARADSGGHIDALHTGVRPVGRHQPAEGAADDYGYFYATYYAGEVGGVVQSVVHCVTLWVACRDGSVSFGVGLSTLQELGVGTGYVLKGARDPHPSNHWGEPNFVAAVASVAESFNGQYPATILSYNDISLQYGGLFDVATLTQTGYDWTPPHKGHRRGTNMDIGIPPTVAQRNTLERLYTLQGVSVLHEDAIHWHLYQR
ncbi:hypothetical protein J2X04_002862 [Lysobacter niabensis]|uniref:Peptidase M15B domain-containing protein n=1 Tax=Agrilutibacter niabensis TaxID=380628 RepID=A0ABU1VSM0_9GAMM|nr:hypothetical protein [Lysobacter niabensis]MDR7100481.1 hypothetical protein [Lysobacter niabensis]